MRRLSALLFALLVGSFGSTARAAPEAHVVVELFSRAGCPRCAAAKVFLEQLVRERPHVRVVERDVAVDAASRTRLRALAAERGVASAGVPSFFVNGSLLVGFSGAETTGARLRAAIDGTPAAAPADAGGTCDMEDVEPCEPPADDDAITVPLLGRVTARSLGLPLFTLVIGLLDGFNPCAMWVLLLLLSFLVGLADRTKVLVVGGAFVLMSGVVYFAFMAAWLNVFLFVGLSRAIQVALAVVAGAVGAVNVKDFFAFKRGISFSIPESKKPGLYRRMRAIVQAERLPVAVAGAVVLAALVNVIELLCTAGFPALYTRILTLHRLPWWSYYGYLALYNVAYVADDGLMLCVALVTLSRRKLQEREGRWLKLVSGVVMLGLATLLLVRPGLLSG